MAVTHEHLFTICRQLPTDYADYGGKVVRWERDDEAYPDCSCGCKWAVWLEAPFTSDWCVCARPESPRHGLLTFEHMAGKDCFEQDETADLPDGPPGVG